MAKLRTCAGRDFDIKDLLGAIHHTACVSREGFTMKMDVEQILANQLQIMKALDKLLESLRFYY